MAALRRFKLTWPDLGEKLRPRLGDKAAELDYSIIFSARDLEHARQIADGAETTSLGRYVLVEIEP